MMPLPPIMSRAELLQTLVKHGRQAQEHQRILGLLLCDIRRFSRINNLGGLRATHQECGHQHRLAAAL